MRVPTFSEALAEKIRSGVLVITSPYGWRTLQGKREWHNGIDLAPVNLKLKGALELEFDCMTFSPIPTDPRKNDCGLGAFIYEDTNLRWGVCHLRAIAVQPSGAIWLALGTTGRSTGIHLHVTCAVLRPGDGWIEVDPLGKLPSQPV